jgi:hypothetical protein
MSAVEASLPSRADIMSVISRLEGSGPQPTPPDGQPVPESDAVLQAVPPSEPFQNAPRPPDAAAAAAPLEASTDSEPWRAALEQLRTEYANQLGKLRADADQQGASAEALRRGLEEQRARAETLHAALQEQRSVTEALHAALEQNRADIAALHAATQAREEQIAHLSAAMTALIELAQVRAGAAPQPVTTPAAPAVPAKAAVQTGYAMPSGMEGVPRTQPPPPPVDPDAPPMTIPKLAPATALPAKTIRLGATTPVARPAPKPKPKPAPEPELVFDAAPEPLPLSPATEFVAPEPPGGGDVILPGAGDEKKRRRRFG